MLLTPPLSALFRRLPDRSIGERWLTLPALLAPLLLGGCQYGVLDPQGPIGAAERTILLNSLAIMLAVVIPVILATFAFAWWFRESNPRAKRLPDFTFSGQIELVVWAIPAMVVLLLSGIAWIGSHDLDPSKPIASDVKPVVVEVVALDWKWLFIYPELGVASVNHLTVPTGTPISMRLTSASVMNSFFVPKLGSQIYAMSGMTTRLNLQADNPGRFPGLSVMYSGKGFSDMRFTVDAVSADQFSGWVDATKGKGDTLDHSAYGTLAERSVAVPPRDFGTVQPGLFDMIVGMPTMHDQQAEPASHTEG